jgi:hypothetical protein
VETRPRLVVGRTPAIGRQSVAEIEGHTLAVRTTIKRMIVDQKSSAELNLEGAQTTCRLREKLVAFAKTRGFSMSEPVAFVLATG